MKWNYTNREFRRPHAAINDESHYWQKAWWLEDMTSLLYILRFKGKNEYVIIERRETEEDIDKYGGVVTDRRVVYDQAFYFDKKPSDCGPFPTLKAAQAAYIILCETIEIGEPS